MDDELARAARAKKGSPFLSTEQAAFYLGLSPRKLQQMRAGRTGPGFRRHGRHVRYHIDDLDAWSRGSGGQEMADAARAPAAPWVDELRQIIAQRRRRRRRLGVAALIAGTAVPLIASILWKPPVLFVWNASASAPIGLYRLHPGEQPRRGDMVIARMPEAARTLAARRHYLPANVPLVKHVAAVAGDRVCGVRKAISINGKPIAVRQGSDGAGRPMPWWNGCLTLQPHEYFLPMDNALSFDGRYFGVTRGGDVLGRADLLWATPAKGSSDG